MKTAIALLIGIALGALLYAYGPDLLLKTGDTAPPRNLVKISDRLHTSGQPSEAQLKGLAAGGYGLVVNLAPPTTAGSVPDEGLLVAGNGIAYVSIPVDWDRPRYEDFVFFSEVLKRAGERRVLVHCQMNFRASTFTFLYRVIYEHADPALAYDEVTAVWAPHEQWKTFAREALARHGIAFDPY
jgi:protein tyrosine phosphatase (PTP) superfamily phosphohydrolase (DUF442 family)